MKDNQGALLITFIVLLTIAGILASSIAYMLQNISFSIKSVNSVEQSYYLSESGLRYVLMKIKEGLDYSELKSTYEKDHEIHIPIEIDEDSAPQDNLFAGHFTLQFEKGELQKRGDMFIKSNAQVSTDLFVESKRQLNAEYDDPNVLDIDFKTEHFKEINVNDGKNDQIWNLTDGFYAVINEIDSIPSLKFMSDVQKNWALASLNWGKNNKLPDLRLYQYVITQVLSYKIQIKINCYPTIIANHPEYGQKGKDFMAGLNFRVMNAYTDNRERTDYYGISLFKSAGRNQGNPPCWLIPDSNDCKQHLGDSFLFIGEDEICQKEETRALCLEPNKPYIIFWIKTKNEENIELLAYSEAEEYTKKLGPLEWGFKNWINLGVFLKEKESAGQRINEIQVSLRATNSKNWTFPKRQRFVRVSQNDFVGTTTKVSDRTLVSKNLSNINLTPPDEIGFHAMYDNRASIYKYNIYFRDFVLDCHGEYCPEKSQKIYVQF